VEVHFFNAGIGTHHGDGLLMEIGSTASAVSNPLGMWGSWSGYDRIRSNPGIDYSWSRAGPAMANVPTASVRDLDLHDFEANILGFAGADAKGAVSTSGPEVTITISWQAGRGAGGPGARETFVLTSRMVDEQGALQ
ncbi:hypothetical protein ACXM5P_29225, partial [Pseudomonas palleroniana]